MYDFNVLKALLWIKIANISIEAVLLLCKMYVMEALCFMHNVTNLKHICVFGLSLKPKIALIIAVEYLHEFNTIFKYYSSTSYHLTICGLFIIQTFILFNTHFIQNNVFVCSALIQLTWITQLYKNSTAHSWIVHTKNF